MSDYDVDAIVLDIVRRQSGREDAGPRSRFTEDLHLSENGRKSLFAFLAEAFSARGLNLPSRGFFQSDFLACETTADVQAAIRDALAGVRKKSAAAAKAIGGQSPAGAAKPAAGGTAASNPTAAKPKPPAAKAGKAKSASTSGGGKKGRAGRKRR